MDETGGTQAPASDGKTGATLPAIDACVDRGRRCHIGYLEVLIAATRVVRRIAYLRKILVQSKSKARKIQPGYLALHRDSEVIDMPLTQ